MNGSIFKMLPAELQRYIYMFLNPITKIHNKRSKLNWCENCGEMLINGDWFMAFGNEEPYLLYECSNCYESNIFYDYNSIDKIILNENN